MNDRRDRPVLHRCADECPHGREGGQIQRAALHARIRILFDDVRGSLDSSSYVPVKRRALLGVSVCLLSMFLLGLLIGVF